MTRDNNRHGRTGRYRRSMGGRVVNLDHIWVRRWQRLRLPVWLERILLAFVRMGDGWGWLVMTVLLALVTPRADFLFLVGQGLCAAVVTMPLYWILKATIRRARPYTIFRNIVPRVAPRDLYSFPSGHTMNNLAIGVSLAVHLPWLWPFALAIPVATGLLRVLFGVHFVSDIVAGSIIGLLAGFAAVAAYPVLLALWNTAVMP
ncbi:MAG TPA: phosphatase PAP2 family protein [Fibrobacteria bacterium]|nr:phosphatase PAP2 family protein [Fibrobacteria bacterium]